MSMYKAQRMMSESMRSKKRQPDQQQQKLQHGAATEESRGFAAKKQENNPQHHLPHGRNHLHQQKQHSQHPLVGAIREPLRQHSNGQQPQQQRRLTFNKQASDSRKGSLSAAPSHHAGGSSTLESVKDAAVESDEANDAADPADSAVAGQPQRQQRQPCLDRAAALPVDLPDVDLNSHCTMVSAYAKDIFVYLAERELHYALPEDFLTGHPDVTEHSRAVLVDWLLQLSSRLDLQADTYHLGVRLLDHYLAIDRNVSKRQLQLVGATALWLASKFEEVYCISMGDLLHLCAGACNRRDLLAMEVRLVGALDFCLLPPLPITFLRRLSKVAGVDNKVHFAAKYLLELATLSARLAWRPASQLAAAAMLIALGSDGRDWSDVLAFYSGYALDGLRQVAADLARACVRTAAAAAESDARHHRFVFQKYRSSKCLAVATCAQLRPDSQFLAGLIAAGSRRQLVSSEL